MKSRRTWVPIIIGWVGLLGTDALATANPVSRIDVEQAGPRRTVRIETAGPPVFATYALEDMRQVVVDIAEGDLRGVAGPLQIGDGVLGDVSFRQFQVGPLLVSRITVDMTVRCSSVVQADGNAVVIHACNGAADIAPEPVLLASTDMTGMEALTALAERAAAFAAAGPFLTDDLLEPPEPVQAPARRGAARVAALRAARAAKRRAIAVATARGPALTRRARRAAARAAMAMAAGNRDARAGYGARQAPRLVREGPAVAVPAPPQQQETTVAFDLEPMVIEGRRLLSDAEREGPIVIRGRRFAPPPLVPAAPALPARTATWPAGAATAAADATPVDREGPIVIHGRRFIGGVPPTGPGPALAGAEPAPGAAPDATLVAVQRLDHHRILLRVKGGGRFKSRHLADPPRFVVDLSGIRRDTVEKFFALDTDQSASRVRLGDQDFGVRAVFDLRDHITRARVRRTKDGLLVAFSGHRPPQAQLKAAVRSTPMARAYDDATPSAGAIAPARAVALQPEAPRGGHPEAARHAEDG